MILAREWKIDRKNEDEVDEHRSHSAIHAKQTLDGVTNCIFEYMNTCTHDETEESRVGAVRARVPTSLCRCVLVTGSHAI